MAAILNKWQHWFSKLTFPMIGPINPASFKEIGQSIQKILSGKEIQDGCCGAHIEITAMLVL
jgi:hypothetical protein